MPSLQIARALVARGHAAVTIELFGSRRGQEATLWPTLEFPFRLLPGRGIRRSMSPAALWANAGAVLGLVWATLSALASFARRRPRVVVVVGGYASFPAGLAAVLDAGAAGPGQHRCGARCRQRPPRAFRGGERRGVSRHCTATGAGHRDPGTPRTGVPRPVGRGPRPGKGRARTAPRAAHVGRLRGLPGRPADQYRRRRPGRALVGSAWHFDLPRGRPA